MARLVCEKGPLGGPDLRNRSGPHHWSRPPQCPADAQGSQGIARPRQALALGSRQVHRGRPRLHERHARQRRSRPHVEDLTRRRHGAGRRGHLPLRARREREAQAEGGSLPAVQEQEQAAGRASLADVLRGDAPSGIREWRDRLRCAPAIVVKERVLQYSKKGKGSVDVSQTAGTQRLVLVLAAARGLRAVCSGSSRSSPCRARGGDNEFNQTTVEGE